MCLSPFSLMLLCIIILSCLLELGPSSMIKWFCIMCEKTGKRVKDSDLISSQCLIIYFLKITIGLLSFGQRINFVYERNTFISRFLLKFVYIRYALCVCVCVFICLPKERCVCFHLFLPGERSCHRICKAQHSLT